MKNDSKSGRLSTNRTEINVERVRQVVYGDRQLTIWMIVMDRKRKLKLN